MSTSSTNKIELTEIADYRGNLSFAEENNPIPFDIKSVFWSTISEDISWTIPAQSFFIIPDGKATVNGELLDSPNQAYLAKEGSKIELNRVSEEATIFLVMDKTIPQEDQSKSLVLNILEMPKLDNFYGLNGYFANSGSTLPFDIKRVYFTYDIPETAKRGGHAHIYTKEIVFPIKGQFDVLTELNNKHTTVHLEDESKGIFLDTGIWRELQNFTDQSLVLVLASETYYEADYIREYADFEEKYQ
ncbi:MAG: FdtA/QdtA family cupin domain-containing protein [Bacteroidales bacterium]|jgi:hypothetical protein|nr:FdtA/QdtA family cupin domain-containing protein [Bacteroidales bacterium]